MRVYIWGGSGDVALVVLVLELLDEQQLGDLRFY